MIGLLYQIPKLDHILRKFFILTEKKFEIHAYLTGAKVFQTANLRHSVKLKKDFFDHRYNSLTFTDEESLGWSPHPFPLYFQREYNRVQKRREKNNRIK